MYTKKSGITKKTNLVYSSQYRRRTHSRRSFPLQFIHIHTYTLLLAKYVYKMETCIEKSKRVQKYTERTYLLPWGYVVKQQSKAKDTIDNACHLDAVLGQSIKPYRGHTRFYTIFSHYYNQSSFTKNFIGPRKQLLGISYLKTFSHMITLS